MTLLALFAIAVVTTVEVAPLPGALAIDPTPAVAVPSDAAPPVGARPLALDPETIVDQQLASRVANAIAEDPALVGAQVTVAARAGAVLLGGDTLDGLQARRAEQIAAAVPGVTQVSSSLSQR